MSRIRIDLDALYVALGDHSSEWVELDTQSGKIMMAEWVRDLRADLGLEVDDRKDDFDAPDGDRFVAIEPVASHKGFRWMQKVRG